MVQGLYRGGKSMMLMFIIHWWIFSWRHCLLLTVDGVGVFIIFCFIIFDTLHRTRGVMGRRKKDWDGLSRVGPYLANFWSIIFSQFVVLSPLRLWQTVSLWVFLAFPLSPTPTSLSSVNTIWKWIPFVQSQSNLAWHRAVLVLVHVFVLLANWSSVGTWKETLMFVLFFWSIGN